MAEIQDALDSLLTSGKAPTSEQVKEIIDDIYYREEREEAARKAELERQAYEAAHKMTLNRFIDNFLGQIDSGARQTDQGRTMPPRPSKASSRPPTSGKPSSNPSVANTISTTSTCSATTISLPS